MKQGLLSEYFDGVAVKRLSAVEADPRSPTSTNLRAATSVACLAMMIARISRPRFIWLNDEQEGVSEPGMVSWYDSRRKQPHRSAEYRLYYADNPVSP